MPLFVKFLKTAGGLSNKIPHELIAYGLGQKIAALIPRIDKLSFTYDVPGGHKKIIEQNIMGLAKEGGVFKNPNLKKPSRFKYRIALNHAETGQAVLIEAHPKIETAGKNYRFMRFELNPNKLGAQGVEFLRTQLVQIFLEDAWPKVAINCNLTRLDVAADLLNVRTAGLIIESAAKSGNAKNVFYKSAEGDLESVYLGLKKGKGPTPVIGYDKGKELADKGEVSEFGIAHFRLERRMVPNKSLTELISIQNPFKNIVVMDLTKTIDPPDGQHNWQFFLDSCRVRGMEAALDILPDDDLRSAYQNAIAEADRKIWQPDKIWDRWPDTLAMSGLLPEKK